MGSLFIRADSKGCPPLGCLPETPMPPDLMTGFSPRPWEPSSWPSVWCVPGQGLATYWTVLPSREDPWQHGVLARCDGTRLDLGRLRRCCYYHYRHVPHASVTPSCHNTARAHQHVKDRSSQPGCSLPISCQISYLKSKTWVTCKPWPCMHAVEINYTYGATSS
jgi:hypothetical protein